MKKVTNQGLVPSISNSPVLTIILPTRNANQLLEYSIDSVLKSKASRFELLIIDNNFPAKVKIGKEKLSDSRLRIVYSGKKLSMSENWHLGLSNARGEWVTFMGSDDGIVSHNLSKVIELIDNIAPKNDAVLFRSIGFTYPLSNRPAWFELPTKLPTQKVSRMRNSGSLVALFPTQMISTLPIPYGGAVCRKKLFSKMLDTDLRIPGIAPDYFLGFYVGLRAKHLLFVDEIFAIRGVSEISNGYQTLNDIQSPNMLDFLKDAESVNKGIFRQGDIKCRTKISTLDYLFAKSYSSASEFNLRNFLFLKISRVTCIEAGHHENGILESLLPTRKFIFNNIGYLIRKSWFFMIGMKTRDLRNQKLYLEEGENISTIQPKIQSTYEKFLLGED